MPLRYSPYTVDSYPLVPVHTTKKSLSPNFRRVQVMTPKNPPDERIVYLALKNIFKGADAQVRKAKKIRDLVLKRQHMLDVHELIKAHNFDNVCQVAKVLLEEEIFASTLKAKIRFPEVFEISPAQSAERSASEEEAARSEADAVKVAAEGLHVENLHEEQAVPRANPLTAAEDVAPSKKRSISHSLHEIPSLYPIYIPYQTQHQLLVKVQGLLEQACFQFGRQYLNTTLERRGWDCAESAELNRWPQVLLSNQEKFGKDELDALGKPFAEILESVTQLRHTAVHRLRVRANRLEAFLVDAEALTRLLGGEYLVPELTKLRRDVQLTIGELERNKDLLLSNLSKKLDDIAERRTELDKLEHLAVQEMLQEDKEYQKLAGANLDEVMREPVTSMHSAAATEVDTRSGDPPVDLGSEAGDLEAGFESDLEALPSK